ncbi:hypothetical protein GCM10023238_01720 [Streptomyces heliomycini]
MTVPHPAARGARLLGRGYPLRTHAANTDIALAAAIASARLAAAGSDWWDEYYTPLTQRLARADPQRPVCRRPRPRTGRRSHAA